MPIASHPGLYQCNSKECRKQFTVTMGTLFERSHIVGGESISQLSEGNIRGEFSRVFNIKGPRTGIGRYFP